MKFDQLKGLYKKIKKNKIKGLFTYNQNLKINVTDKLIYETETNSQRTNL